MSSRVGKLTRWGLSSVGRASALHAEGHGFDSRSLQKKALLVLSFSILWSGRSVQKHHGQLCNTRNWSHCGLIPPLCFVCDDLLR